MKIVIDARDDSKKAKPSKDDLMLFDGKQWYITTRKDVFGELEKKINEALVAYSNAYNELAKQSLEQQVRINELEQRVSKELLDMASLIGGLYEK